MWHTQALPHCPQAEQDDAKHSLPIAGICYATLRLECDNSPTLTVPAHFSVIRRGGLSLL